MKELAAVVLVILVLAALACVGTYGYLYLYRDAAPRFAEAHRQTFERTRSFVHGKITHLTQLQSDYRRAKDEEARETLRDLIKRAAATVDPADLPHPLRRFVESL